MNCRCGGALALKRRRVLNSTQVVRACVECGDLIGQIGAREIRELTRYEIESLPWLIHKKKPQPTARKRAQRAHQQSKAMRELRKRVFERDNHECRICGDPATDLYHLNTDSYGRETEADVVASCRECNLAEREKRITDQVLGTR